MKKIFALGAATVCALGFASSVFAAETPTTIEALYDVDESYTVTFPAGIEFDGYNDDQIVTVEADDVLLNDGNKLKITMISTNGALKNGTSSIAYTMANGENEPEDIVASTPFDILTIESSDRNGDTATLTFTSGDDTDVTLAGKHSDTLTFKVEIDDGTVRGSFTDARDGKEYTTAQLAGKTWMTQNLAYVPEGATWESNGIMVAEDTGEVYYNWNAAMEACPSGWTLPSKTDFENLISAAILTEDNILSSPFYGVLAGHVFNGDLTYVGEVGDYWSSTEAGSNFADHFHFEVDYIYNEYVNEKMQGYSVRCVAE